MKRRGRERGREREGLRLVLVRAAETGFSREGRLAGDVDVPLTPRGREDSRCLMEEMVRGLGGVDAVYCAENQGARETAEVLARANSYRIRTLPGLNGVSLGLWEGQLAVDVRLRHRKMFGRWRRDPLSFTPPGGEEMAQAAKRARLALETIARKHPSGVVAVVSTKTVVSLLYCLCRELPPERVFEVEERLGPAEVVRTPALR